MRNLTESEIETIKENIGRCVDGKMLAGDAYRLLLELAEEWKSNAIRHTNDDYEKKVEMGLINKPRYF